MRQNSKVDDLISNVRNRYRQCSIHTKSMSISISTVFYPYEIDVDIDSVLSIRNRYRPFESKLSILLKREPAKG